MSDKLMRKSLNFNNNLMRLFLPSRESRMRPKAYRINLVLLTDLQVVSLMRTRDGLRMFSP